MEPSGELVAVVHEGFVIELPVGQGFNAGGHERVELDVTAGALWVGWVST